MTTSHSEPPEEAERQELIPALSPEVQERDPGLIALVRGLVALELRLAEGPRPPLSEADEDEVNTTGELEELELELRRYAEEMTVARKVDHYTSLLAYLEWQRDALEKESRRLARRKKATQSIIDRMLGAAHYALSLLPPPLYRKVRTLDGVQSSLALVKNPGRVRVIDQAAVPPEWRQATVKLNLRLWLQAVNALPPDLRDQVKRQASVTDEVIANAVNPVLKGGATIPGVELVQDYRVARR